jgi:hypothetical protein
MNIGRKREIVEKNISPEELVLPLLVLLVLLVQASEPW